jgi:NAD(P)-dependent dehydrogenase (short-subunit alcohol dehydrogenase family)
MKGNTMGEVTLVTGTSSGFGRLAAASLARRGHRVFAGVRDIAGRNEKAAAELASLHENLTVVELDVTDQDSAGRAVAEVIAAAGRLDVVVNNAGATYAGPLEAWTAEEARRQFDLNAFGALRVNRAALPHLREQGRGLLIQIGSTGGRVTTPFVGLYSASKAALASLTEAWRYELAPAGIESVLVEPAPYPTNLGANGTMPADAARMAPYQEMLGRFMADVTAHQSEHVPDPQEVADLVVALVEAPAGTRAHRTVAAPPAQAEVLNAAAEAAARAARTVIEDMGMGAVLS